MSPKGEVDKGREEKNRDGGVGENSCLAFLVTENVKWNLSKSSQAKEIWLTIKIQVEMIREKTDWERIRFTKSGSVDWEWQRQRRKQRIFHPHNDFIWSPAIEDSQLGPKGKQESEEPFVFNNQMSCTTD